MAVFLQEPGFVNVGDKPLGAFVIVVLPLPSGEASHIGTQAGPKSPELGH